MMLEMTQLLPWVDLVFGLVEGWWLFDDGRTHALSSPDEWKRSLHSAGYGHVDWTDGELPKAAIQRVIFALPDGSSRYAERSLTDFSSLPLLSAADFTAREKAIDLYVLQHTQEFCIPKRTDYARATSTSGRVILVTGATGSLGSHLVAHLVLQPTTRTVVCANRHVNGVGVEERQMRVFQDRGIVLDAKHRGKLRVIEVDAAKRYLGLSESQYRDLANQVTDIIHNAWPMSINRPLPGFSAQFLMMSNFLQLASDASGHQLGPIGFQFVSSIATVGCQPLWTKNPIVGEQWVDVRSVLPTGYGDAKLVCERMLKATLLQHPQRFRSMIVRIAQISGSATSGYWNSVEHFASIIKSSQALGVLPKLHGTLSWCPVTDVSATLTELLLTSAHPSYPIYQIENPSRQPWEEMLSTLSDALEIDQSQVIPFARWIQLVRDFGMKPENPACRILDFLDENFVRMSCGHLVLETTHSREHSPTLRNCGPVSMQLVRKYIQAWRDIGFLQ